MSVRVRLTRVGSKKNPIWRVVVADQRSPRDGRVIETIGRYNPQTEPSVIELDEEKYVGTGTFLFASVLERFLGAYASINSFTRLVARSRQGEGVIKRWPPRAGDRTLI